MNGHDESWFLRPRFELVSQMRDVGIDGPGRRIVLMAPDVVEQPVATQRLSGMRDEDANNAYSLMDSSTRCPARRTSVPRRNRR